MSKPIQIAFGIAAYQTTGLDPTTYRPSRLVVLCDDGKIYQNVDWDLEGFDRDFTEVHGPWEEAKDGSAS